MSRTLTMDEIELLREDLQGTCKSMDEACQELFDVDDSFEIDTKSIELVEAEVFLCSDCEWWYEIGEAEMGENNDGDVCESCHAAMYPE